ncbi:hypothetical protein BDV40DRAFT_311131 [Aspergillus tamarii]|uniref:Aerobactin siderophore biosynthesis IucA/IucC N-terminal domain-containing protein n=1 Tax=Aspergillus tamarii TaxID=41984 RepID=A0A5N6UZH0_ASPTM|nr:hypothetical protein BDV40DRAFT_311131 [Aspergillus tamarii]
MTVAAEYRVKAKAETAKRLIAQLVNEGLVNLTLYPGRRSPGELEGQITPECGESRCIKTDVVQGNGPIWRPKNFKVPVTLCNEGVETQEDNPGTIFEFISIGFACNMETREAIARELRNSADMLAKWMEIAAKKPLLDLNCSFIDWEQSLITGHPSHPASLCGSLSPVGPDDLPDMLNPGLSFVILPRSSARVFGPFEDLLRPLRELLEVDISTTEDKIIVPCLSQHLPSLQNFFPEAEIVASVPQCAQAQASIRSVSVPGYGFDIKFSLACLITSALRVLPCWSAAAAPSITPVLKKLFPPDLWVFGEVAAITGSQENASEARHLTCILRENMEAKANERDETLILASALMEKPFGRDVTYAEILFDLTTREAVEKSLVTCVSPYGELPPVSRRLNPFPALLPRQFPDDIRVFQEALTIALNNIVERWWKDEEANFPSRMPLEPQAEDLLRGNLRPDILIPAQTEGKDPEFRVCEINGRFPISFISHVACVYEALAGCLKDSPVFEPATRYDKVQEGLLALFNPNLPIHFVSEGKDFPRTSPLFGLIEKRTGMRPRQVKSKDLRLVPSKASRTGLILCCVWGADPDVSKTSDMPQLIKVNGEALEEVHQIGLQLFDYELFSLPLEMVRHIGLCCVNDPRSVFIAHDKRILGIILQELDALLNKHKVLSPAQAQILRERIIPTILPGSSEFKTLLDNSQKDPQAKNGYILKPVRDARGHGILLGKNISVQEWETILASLVYDSASAATTVLSLVLGRAAQGSRKSHGWNLFFREWAFRRTCGPHIYVYKIISKVSTTYVLVLPSKPSSPKAHIVAATAL